MNRWAAFLAQTPPTLQRLIASSQRVSLPRRCSPAERIARLRAALCRPATVRAVYFTLAPDEQQAVQALRHTPRGLAADTLAARFGPLRSLAELQVDRAPRSLSERLLLLGWLLPRPATRNHPTRYLLPPELRAWLPVPLLEVPRPPDTAPTPSLDQPPAALRAASAVLAAAAAAPLPLRQDGRPTAAALRVLRPHLAPLPAREADAVCRWLLPLLGDLGLLAPHGSAAIPGPAARRFLAAPLGERRQMLRDAWVRAPRPDQWLVMLRVKARGLDWPVLRRRLCAWAAALPPDASADPAATYELLQAALGPLADATTHGLGAWSRRGPWLPHRAAAVWAAACEGPLRWLGLVPSSHSAPGGTPDDAALAPDEGATMEWQATPEGTIVVPHGPGEADLLTLAAFACFNGADGETGHYRLSRESVARATALGHDPARLRAALLHRCGDFPAALEATLTPGGGLQMVAGTVVLSDRPHELAVALRRRSVRRAVSAQLAPGVALVAPGREAALARALARDGRAVAAPPTRTAEPVPGLTYGEAAALLLSAAHYRASAPADAPPGPPDELLVRLRAALPPALGAATDAALAGLRRPSPTAPAELTAGGETLATADRPPLAALIEILRAALRRRGVVRLRYQGANEVGPCDRTVRPLRLERHGPWWYLHAYCLLARAERCFRLDRVRALVEGAEGSDPVMPSQQSAPLTGARPRRGQPIRPRSVPRSGFFAGLPGTPPGSPLVRVWLDEELDQPVGRLSSDSPDPVNRDPLHCVDVQPVAAYAVGVKIDQSAQLSPQLAERLVVEQTLEDAVLDAGAVALEQLHNPGAALVLDDVVADDGEHMALRL